jgi:hypothetical protein
MSDRYAESTLNHVVQNKNNVWKRVSNLHFLDAGFKKNKDSCECSYDIPYRILETNVKMEIQYI